MCCHVQMLKRYNKNQFTPLIDYERSEKQKLKLHKNDGVTQDTSANKLDVHANNTMKKSSKGDKTNKHNTPHIIELNSTQADSNGIIHIKLTSDKGNKSICRHATKSNEINKQSGNGIN